MTKYDANQGAHQHSWDNHARRLSDNCSWVSWMTEHFKKYCPFDSLKKVQDEVSVLWLDTTSPDTETMLLCVMSRLLSHRDSTRREREWEVYICLVSHTFSLVLSRSSRKHVGKSYLSQRTWMSGLVIKATLSTLSFSSRVGCDVIS